ncbi:hypothetical protein N0V83_007865 [Neocucurbitaria cava]|uniref:Uncharacterized protein n=1 Tax=Neocucurbitaria cava TaxID=798079 RepID=A0A9W8Y3L7_9PLEO|nr:hypothetical protein N0V83_007865 [Neocucurbitaria cava]
MTRPQQQNPPPPPTPGEKDIEAARRRAVNLYRTQAPTPDFDNWYINPPFRLDVFISSRVCDLYTDRGQSNRQQGALFVAKLNLPDAYLTADPVLKEEQLTKYMLYSRALDLYDARLKYIQEEGVKRLSVWSTWHAAKQQMRASERSKLVVTAAFTAEEERLEGRVAACESTLEWTEDDYCRRKMDFVGEVYALLEACGDWARGKVLLDELGEMYEWLRMGAFRGRLEDGVVVVVYDGLKRVVPQV